jgi:hypothetical protein
MDNKNEKNALGSHSIMTPLDKIKQLCEQYKKHINPPNKKTDDLSYLELLKAGITRNLLLSVKHPKKLLTILQDKCDDPYFSSMTNADVLRMNRSNPLSLFFKGLLVLLTFPVSLPLLMFWSFKTKGTLNFLKADGEIFLEQLIPLCTNWVEPPPRSTSRNTPTPSTNSTLRDLNPMPKRDHFAQNRSTALVSGRSEASVSALVPRHPEAPATEEPIELLQVENPDLKNMRRLATQMVSVFSNPRETLDRQLLDFKGKAMITVSLPIRPVGTENPNALRLEFTCQFMYTDAPPVQCEIILCKTFSPMVRATSVAPPLITAGSTAARPQTQSYWMQRSQQYCKSFFADNFGSMMQKGHQNVGQEEASDLLKTVKYYERALNLATTDVEKLQAIEAIINSIHDSRKLFEGVPFPNFELNLQKRTKAALRQLPTHYRFLSEDIKHTTASFQTVWTFLENNQPKEAWTVFRIIAMSHFLEQSCPELDAMHCQLSAVFQINGEHEQLESGALTACGLLQAAYLRLSQQNYSLCLLTEYDPSRGAELGKIYFAETMNAPLNYVIRNDSDTADWVGTITQEEIRENGILMEYCSGDPEDFIWRLDEQLSRVIAVLVEKGHAQQPCTPEATLMRQLAIKPMGRMQQRAAEAWIRTPFQEGRARAYAFDDSKKESIWNGYWPSLRTDKAPKNLPKKEFFLPFQADGVTDPSLRYPDDDTEIDDENTSTSSNLTRR